MPLDNPVKRQIFVMSDSSGETASRSAHTALEQFGTDVSERRFPIIESAKEVEEIIQLAAETNAFVVYTLVRRDLREAAQAACERCSVRTVDLFHDLIPQLSLWLGLEPLEEAGHRLDEEYFARKAATSFAQKHDDGQNLGTLHMADVIVLGLSRSSKTPVSHELARSGLRVANIPLVPKCPPPRELLHIDPRRVFVLKLDPERLQKIRMSRLASLGTGSDSPYVNPVEIEQEYLMLDELLRHNRKWHVVKTTDRAIEEIASRIRHRYERTFKEA